MEHKKDTGCRCDENGVSWCGLGLAISGTFNLLFVLGSATAAAIIFGG